MSKRSDEVWHRAWGLHRRNGHPKGYDGPCWGPTLAELDQARLDVYEAEKLAEHRSNG